MNQPTATLSAIEKARIRLQEIKAAKAAKLASQQQDILSHKLLPSLAPEKHGPNSLWQIDSSRDWNAEQLLAITTGLEGKSFCLIGAAGTGKTSTLKGLVLSLLQNSLLPIISADQSTKYLHSGKPGIALVSFTNMAVRQIAKHFSQDITCCTIHKLLEYAPVTYEVEDPETGLTKKQMRFEPSRNAMNKLPRSLRTIVVDESSMVDIALIEQIKDALPNPDAVQWIFLGDLNQLPPVYGGPILGRALLTLPIVELTRVYRQALESPIISTALAIKDGNGTLLAADQAIEIDKGEHGKLTIKPWSKPISDEDALNKAANFCKGAIKAGIFDPYKDMILIPFNKSFGTIELNKSISDWLGRERNATVVEVIAGFNTHYLAVGDKVLVNKREAIITSIAINRSYSGKRPVDPRVFKLDRWGGATKIKGAEISWEQQNDSLDVDAILQSMSAAHTEIEDRKHQASHIVTVRFINGTDPSAWTDKDDEESDELYETALLETAAQINDMLGGYAVTVHKSQGSEWRKVIFFMHQKHSAMCSRELVYTAITRAAQELIIICEPDRGIKSGSLMKAAKTPRLKGNTLAEKLVSLKEKFDQEEREALAKKGKGDENEEE
jgi:ATP-dependent exoDNAse (exonuclease V) alpha subunit